MRMRNFLGLTVLSIYAGKGLYNLYQYYTYKNNYNQALANVTKDAIDGVNDLTKIFSNNKQEIDLTDDAAQLGKSIVDCVIEAENRT